MTFLKIFDMYLMICDINSQYFAKFSQYFVKISDLEPRLLKSNNTAHDPARIPELGGALAGQKNLLYGLGQNSVAGNNVDTSRFWIIFEKIQNCRQIIGLSRRSIFNAPKSSQMQYTVKIKKTNNFNNKVKVP